MHCRSRTQQFSPTLAQIFPQGLIIPTFRSSKKKLKSFKRVLKVLITRITVHFLSVDVTIAHTPVATIVIELVFWK